MKTKTFDGKELCGIVRYMDLYGHKWLEIAVSLIDKDTNGSMIPYGVGSGSEYADHEFYDGLCYVQYLDLGCGIPYQLEYRNVFSVNLRSAKRMTKTIATIERKLKRMNEVNHVSSFGELAYRFFKAIGVKRFFIQDNCTVNFKKPQWFLLPLNECTEVVNRRLSSLRNTHCKLV